MSAPTLKPERSPGVVWRMLDFGPAQAMVALTCRIMDAVHAFRHGPPDLRSENGVVRLWRATYKGARWTLDDGGVIAPGDLVFELHIANRRLFEIRQAQPNWRTLIRAEFRSLSRQWSGEEAAIVGETTLRKQVLEFGGSVRDMPPGLMLSLDTFYRRLILLAFHPARSRRAAFDTQKLIEAAISRDRFRRLYG